jgi:hypothetical protein
MFLGKKAHPLPSPGQPAGLPTHVIELRTFTPTDVTSGLMARSTFVGPWPLKAARMSLFAVTKSWNIAAADAFGGFAARSAAPSLPPIITAGRLSSKPAVLAIAIGSPATLLIMTADGARCVCIRDFLAEHACTSVNNRYLARSAGIYTRAAIGVGVEEIKRRRRQGAKSPTAAPIVVPPPAG